MSAIGYLRQSRRADLDLALSPEQQRRDIADLAARNGQDNVRVFEDLGRSGGQGKERHRAGYIAMVAALEAGGVADLYTKTLTRLGRSVTELYRVLRIAEAMGTRIVTAKEGVMDPTTAIGKAQFGMLAVFAEFERDLAVDRAKDNAAARRARGERMGRIPYGERPGEDPAAVVAAYREAGSYTAAARLLNERRVPSWGGRPWGATTVRLIVGRLAPEDVIDRPAFGQGLYGAFALAGVLRCACGKSLTGTHNKGGKVTRYKCHAAESDPAHPHPHSLTETNILPWIVEEADRLRLPDTVEADARGDAKRADLAARRERIVDALEAGTITRVEAEPRLARIADEWDTIVDVAAVMDVPKVDWTWPAADVNAHLRLLWEAVELDATMRPVRAVWRLPAEYVAANG